MWLVPILPLMILCSVLPRVWPFIGYDCENSSNNLTVVSIRDIQPCPNVETDYVQEELYVQVIQRNEFKRQQVFACLMEVTQLVRYWGAYSHSSSVKNGFSTSLESMGKNACRKVHRSKYLFLRDKYIGNLILNGTTSAELTVAGTISEHGTCQGSNYTSNGHTRNTVVVVIAVKIHLRDYSATVNLETNEINLLNGVTCAYLNGYCVDSTYGETEWDLQVDKSCDATLTSLYKGPAELVTSITSSIQPVLVIEQNEKVFALSLLKTTLLCDLEVWQSEHPRILVLKQGNSTSLVPQLPLLTKNANLFYYINSKLLYVEQAYKRSLNKLYADTIHRRCLTHREILRNRLLLAPLSPNALYYVEGKWIALYPTPVESVQPQQIPVEAEPKLNFKPIGLNGFNTQTEIEKLHRTLTFATQREVVENVLTLKLEGYEPNNQGLSFTNIFNKVEIKKLAHNTLYCIWGWFTDIGIFMSGLIGVYIVLRVIKYCFGVLLNGLAIYQTVGCGVQILGSVWNTLTMWLIHRHHKKSSQDVESNAASEPLTKVEMQEVISIHPSIIVRDSDVRWKPQTLY